MPGGRIPQIFGLKNFANQGKIRSYSFTIRDSQQKVRIAWEPVAKLWLFLFIHGVSEAKTKFRYRF